MKINVFLIDDHEIVLNGLSRIIDNSTNLACCGKALCIKSAIKKLKVKPPDIILLDIKLSEYISLDYYYDLYNSVPPTCKIIILSNHEKADYITKVIQLKAYGYLLKNLKEADLINAIERINSGYVMFPSDLWIKHEAMHRNKDPYDDLTNQETKVFKLLMQDNYRKEISDMLNISTSTVNKHINKILKKYKVNYIKDLKIQIRG